MLHEARPALSKFRMVFAALSILILSPLMHGCGAGGSGGSSPAGISSSNSPVARFTYPGEAVIGTDVPTSSSVVISFSSEISPATLNADTLRVDGPDGPISGSVGYQAGTATFTPFAPLKPQTSYRVTLSAAVQDLQGHSLGTGQTWAFRTGNDTLVRAANEVITSTFFGQHIHRAATSTPWPSAAFGTWRLWDAYVCWPNLEPNKGEWHFQTLDKSLALAAQHNVEVIMPLALSPSWASARPSEASYYGLGNAAEPANIEDWKNYVRTVATRYKGQIHYYEIWNEMELKGFYSGSIDEMVTMAKEAYNIIKEIDPSAAVLSPSCTNTNHSVSWFEMYLQKGGGQYADIIAYHFYVRPAAPEEMVPFIQSVKKVLSNHNLSGKPLWNTESGWDIANKTTALPSGPDVLSESEASAYVARSFILNWATGINRFMWYAWDNKIMGLVESDGATLKSPAVAFSQVYTWLNGSKMVSCGKNSQGTWVTELEMADGHRAWVVWNPDRTLTMPLPKEWKVVQRLDLLGTTTDMGAASQITISSAPALFRN